MPSCVCSWQRGLMIVLSQHKQNYWDQVPFCLNFSSAKRVTFHPPTPSPSPGCLTESTSGSSASSLASSHVLLLEGLFVLTTSTRCMHVCWRTPGGLVWGEFKNFGKCQRLSQVLSHSVYSCDVGVKIRTQYVLYSTHPSTAAQ